MIAWFAIVFTGKYPEGLYNFNAGYLRMSGRVNGFEYLLSDEWPPVRRRRGAAATRFESAFLRRSTSTAA